MTIHQVLARKWRPKTFAAMVGQSYVLQALENALTQQRLHHAYLFTGTRGVGKTSLARILAKCLNCETGVTSKPCGECSACQAIDRGTFIDLIEVDAASRTKVEDTRELLDNVQYLPTVGRFKIYLIDEVHMLSGHSFNALLKTLEEPPPHVKFLLATTDPHKLPVTILSRCLQFHLKHLSSEAIAEQLRVILEAEQLPAEDPAICLIAEAAQGSMRDGLSLLDQAIAFGAGVLRTEQVRALLGSIDPEIILNALAALQAQSPSQLLAVAAAVGDESGDFEQALKQLGKAFHDLTVLQTVKDASLGSLPVYARLVPYISAFGLEDLQLFYQIALNGCRDLAYAPSLRAGFEMSLLRMLAFRPKAMDVAYESEETALEEVEVISHVKMEPPPRKIEVATPVMRSTPASTVAVVATAREPSTSLPLPWGQLIAQLNLSGMAAALASHCVLESYDGKRLVCLLSPKHAPLHNAAVVDRLSQALTVYLGQPVICEIKMGEVLAQTPAEAQALVTEAAHREAKSLLEQDPVVQGLREVFGAKLDVSSS